MDHSCFKCGQSVEDGIPFCTHCSAPQIRVIMPEAPPPALSMDDATPGQQPAVFLPDSPVALKPPAAGIRSDGLRPCALAASSGTILMFLGLHPFVAMLTAGVFAVAFYRYRRPVGAIDAWTGIRLGALSGLIWFGLSSVAGAIVVWAMGKGPELRAEMIKRIQEQASHTTDPQAIAMFDYFRTPAGLDVMIMFGIVFALACAVVLSGLGGALSGLFVGRRKRS